MASLAAVARISRDYVGVGGGGGTGPAGVGTEAA